MVNMVPSGSGPSEVLVLGSATSVDLGNSVTQAATSSDDFGPVIGGGLATSLDLGVVG
jgi:hypothetical protein